MPGRSMARCRSVAGALLLSLSLAAAADTGSLQVQLAANGRFDLLEQLLEREEAQGPLKTRERHALCFAYSKTKRYDRLMACLDKLAENVRKGDTRTRLLGLDDATPTIHIMRADAFIELGRYGDAVTEAQRGLNWLIESRSDDVDMRIHCMAAVSLAYTLSGDRVAGAAKAEELARIKIGPTTDYVGARAMALGRVYMALGDYGRAIEAIESDRTFRLRSFLDNVVSGAFLRGVNNWVWVELPRHFMITKALFETGQLADARKGYDELLQVPQVRANGEIHWQLLADRGRLAELDGELERAIGYYHRAVEVIEQQRLTISTEANKIGFVGDKQAVYGRLVDALFRAGRASETFDIVERAKSRALVDLLAARDGAAAPILQPRRAQPLLAELSAAGADDLAQVPLDMSQTTVVEAGRRSARLAMQLRQVDPELASLVAVGSVPVQSVQRRLLPDEVVLQYYLHGPRLYAVTVSSTEVRVTPLASTGLETSVRRFRALIEEGSVQAIGEAQALHERLVRPVVPQIVGKSLLVVPHGVLHYLPFAALHDGEAFLLDTHALRYLPIASVLEWLGPARAQGLEKLLVLGNPDLGDARYDLPHAEAEARLIAKLSAGSELLLRKDASEEAFKRLAPSHRYIHVASHGEFNASDALQSRLLLSKSGNEDGSLSVVELYATRLDADLVTLSACETGLGKVLSGDDVLGLTRGFLYAGTSNIVASHWPVDDRATGVLMKHFYRNMLEGVPKREALRQAQIETRREFPHPFFWAAFFLTGLGL